MAVFHDRFAAFREEVKELLEKKQVRQEGRAPCCVVTNSLHALTGCPECLVGTSMYRALMAGHSSMRLCNTFQKTCE